MKDQSNKSLDGKMMKIDDTDQVHDTSMKYEAMKQ